MEEYQALSSFYDELTQDVPYDKWLNFYKSVFKKFSANPKLVLDLGCGTGSMSVKLAKEGYEVIGVDGSSEMLSIAMEKAYLFEENRPIFIQQQMSDLDLYGTIDAAVSSLDSLNYVIKPELFKKALQRVSLFLNPKGLFLFDMQSADGLCMQNKKTTIKEAEDVFCVWESHFSKKTMICSHFIELFAKITDDTESSLWERFSEVHKERAYELDFVIQALKEAGFESISVYPPFKFTKLNGKEDRWFFVAQKP